MNPVAFGSSKKMYVAFLLFTYGNYNPQGYDEEILLPTWMLHTQNITEDDIMGSPIFSVSHHAVQRLFERSELISADNFYDAYTIISEEMEYTVFWVSLLSFQLTISLSEKRHLLPYIEESSFIIPSPNGAFIAEYRSMKSTDPNRRFFCVKTFLSMTDLKPAQLRLRQKMIDISVDYHREPFSCIQAHMNFLMSDNKVLFEVWFNSIFSVWRYFIKIGFVDEYLSFIVNDNLNKKAILDIKREITDPSRFDFMPDAYAVIDWGDMPTATENNIINSLYAMHRGVKKLDILNIQD